MTNLGSKYWLPVAVAGLILAETFGTDGFRRDEPSDLLRRIDIAALQVDTTRQDTAATDSAAALSDARPSGEKPEGKSRGRSRKKDRKGKNEAVKPPKPPRAKPKEEIFIWDDDTMFFGDDGPLDSIPVVTVRDTVPVPDSIQAVNPFLYKWYWAARDSLVHRIVVDSLKAAGDSLDWPVIDSLYLTDSAAVAKEAFDRWYASLSKAERKRYEYEKMLPKLLHEQDSILQRQDSLQAIRDSIRQNTPRILESGFIPDSMQYKRFITWRHDRAFNRLELFDYDTTFNHHFHDYPFRREDVNATWLGVAGSPVQTYNFFKRNTTESVSFYEPYESWTYTPESLPMFNTKTPYTELEYYGTLLATSSKESDNLRLFTTQNILPQLNFALEYKLHGGNGILQNEDTKNKTTVIALNWLGRKYLAHGGFIRNKIVRQENGGVQDIAWIRDTLVDVREVAVNLSNASNQLIKKTFFFDQSYRIPFTFLKKRGLKKEILADAAYRDSVTAAWRAAHPADTTAVPDSLEDERPAVDSTDLIQMEKLLAERAAKREEYIASLDSLDDVTTLFVGTSSEYSVYTKFYTDKVSASDKAGSAVFRDQFYLNPSASSDSLRYARLDNRLFLRVQPWSEDFIVSRIEGGIGDRWLSHYMMRQDPYLYKPASVNWNTLYTYAGAEGKLGKAIAWNALATYNLLGDERNDFSVGASTRMTFHPFRRQRKSPLVVRASFETTLKRPDYFQQQFNSNHYRWNADFGKVSTTKLQGSVDIPKWRLNAFAGYALLANNIYYDTLGIARQNPEAMSVLTAGLRKDLVFGDFLHLDNKLLFQLSSKPDVLPLPTLALNLRYYIQFNIVRADVMKMQLGTDIRYNTAWYAPYYNPVTGTFMAQKETLYHNGPAFDLFMNVQWKRACLFVKWENAGRGWPATKRDYFTAHRFIGTERVIKLGIYWPFYTMSGKNATLSSKAGSGMSGGGGGGGSLGGGLGGMMGGLRGGM